MFPTTEAETTPITLHRDELGSWWISGPADQVINGARVAARRPDGGTSFVTVDAVYSVHNGVAHASPGHRLDDLALDYLTTVTPRLTKLDRAILRYVEENPGCTRIEAGTLGRRDWLPPREAPDFEWQVHLLIHCGLIREEGRAHQTRLYLTEEGKRAAAGHGPDRV